jgi:hypothetical protein
MRVGRPAKPGSATSDPHVRRNHRRKTHGGWQVRQPEPGTWLWRSPHRRIYLVNATGTHPLGNTEFAQTIWRVASPPDELANWPELTDRTFGFSLMRLKVSRCGYQQRD